MDEITDEIAVKFMELLSLLRDAKPEERSELSRRYSIAITDVEKSWAYYAHMIMET